MSDITFKNLSNYDVKTNNTGSIFSNYPNNKSFLQFGMRNTLYDECTDPLNVFDVTSTNFKVCLTQYLYLFKYKNNLRQLRLYWTQQIKHLM